MKILPELSKIVEMSEKSKLFDRIMGGDSWGQTGASVPFVSQVQGISPPGSQGMAPYVQESPSQPPSALNKIIGGMEKVNNVLEATPFLGHFLRSTRGELQERDLKARERRDRMLAQTDFIDNLINSAIEEQRRKTEKEIAETKARATKEAAKTKASATERAASIRARSALEAAGMKAKSATEAARIRAEAEREAAKTKARIAGSKSRDAAINELIRTYSDADDDTRSMIMQRLGEMGFRMPQEGEDESGWFKSIITNFPIVYEKVKAMFGGRSKVKSDPLGLFK